MKKIYNHLVRVYFCISCWLSSIRLKKHCLYLAFLYLFFLSAVRAQTNNYFGTTGALDGTVWSTNAAGPYTLALNNTSGAIINFGNPATVAGATISVVAINATADVLWSNAGTFATGGIVIPITVAGGKTLDMAQAMSIAAGTGFNKFGAGVLALSVGSAYPGGFTLNDGTIIVGGVNAMGAGTLNLNGGIVAANSSRNLTGKYPGGINIGGNVQFGDITGLASNTANLTFTNNISLGGINRSLTIGNAGTTVLGGVISGSNGISFTKNINGTGLLDITNTTNTFTGPVNINGGQIRFAADSSFGNTANLVVIDGGQLLTNISFSLLHNMQLGTTTGTGISVASLASLTINGIIADKASSGSFTKYGAGILELTNANTYTGTTYIDPAGGTLQLNRAGGNTIPVSNNMVVYGGTLKISSDQTLQDLSLVSGNLAVDNGVTLTINGIFDYFNSGTITLNGTGKIIYGPIGTLRYSGTVAKTITAAEFPASGGPFNVINNNAGGIGLPFNRIISGSLSLNIGIFTIGGSATLDLNGASLNSGGGYLAGNTVTGSTSDLVVRGTTGGIINLPTNLNIGLRNLTIGGTRRLALNGIHDLNLSGVLSIAAGAVFDNGGESQIVNSGGSISITGKFITRDLQGFTGTNSSIPGIIPALNTGCTIEYGLAGNQAVSSRNDYQHIVFSGSGIKTLSSGFNPAGTVYITGAATVDAANHTFGDANTSLTMDGGRFRLTGTNNPQPHMSGTYNLTGGVIEFACNSITGQTIRNKTYQNIEVSGLYVGNSNGNISLNSNGTFTVKPGGVFEINDNSIAAAPATSGQIVTVENNGIFLCGNNQGFNGYTPSLLNNSSIHSNITNIALDQGTPGSSVQYTRAGDQPITNANALVYHHLVLSGSGVKTAPAGILTIHGNLSKTTANLFNHNNGRVLFNNTTSMQTISSGATPGFSFYDITSGNTSAAGLTISSNIGIIHALAFSANSKLNLTTGDITLLSTPAITARVEQVPASVSITYGGTGRFVVERYFPAYRSWRLITSPLSSDNTPTTIFSQLQNNGVYTVGRGAFVTGPNPNTAVNGLDDSNFDNYSLKTYQNNGYVNIGDTRVPLCGNTLAAANIGYFMFVRGDRNRSPDNTIIPNSNNTTLSSRGKLQYGTQIFPGLTRASLVPRLFTLLGNPYASPVDFKNVTRNNIVNRFIVWDPRLNVVGGFVTVDDYDDTGTYTNIPSSPGGQDKNIQSSQAFFVETDSLPGASLITFDEANKSVVNNQGIFRPVNPAAAIASFKSSLYLVNLDNSITLADGNLAMFKDRYNDAVDFQDALKFTNVNESFSLVRNNTAMALERRPQIKPGDTLFFSLTHITQRNYRFLFEPRDLDPLLSVVLEDSYTGIKTPLSSSFPGTYNFTVSNKPESAIPNRFRIVFDFVQSGVLPVTYKELKAYHQGSNNVVQWMVENETDIIRYEVQKSNDGTTFNNAGVLDATAGNSNRLTYQWLDKKPGDGDNYYRIASIGINGKTGYSQVVRLAASSIAPGIYIYPNPVTDGSIRLKFKNMKAGFYQVRLINSMGQTILVKTISHSTDTITETIRPEYKPVAGVYQIELATSDKKIITINVIIK